MKASNMDPTSRAHLVLSGVSAAAMHVCIYIYTYTHMYIYIYMYVRVCFWI